MATRSKNFNYSFFSKALAFILAVLSVVLVIACAFTVTFFWRDYDAKNLPPNKTNLEETRPFMSEVGALSDCAVDMLTKYLNDDMVNSGEAFRLTEEKIWADYSKAVSAEIKARSNELDQYKLSAEEYGDYSQYLDMNYYNVAEDGTLSVNVQHIESVLKSTYNVKVQNEKNSFLSNYNRIKDYLSKVIDLKYVVILQSNGTVISNVEGVDASADFDSVFRETYPWYMSVTGTSTFSIVNRHNSGDDFSSYDDVGPSMQMYNALTQKLLAYHNEKNVDFYFVFDEEANSEDCVFSGIMHAYTDARIKYVLVIVVLFSSLFVFFLLTTYLINVCGKTSKDSPIKLIWIDGVPLSLHLFFSWLPVYFIVRTLYRNLKTFSDKIYEFTNVPWYIATLIIVAVSGAIIAFFVLEFVLSLARHIKAKTVFSGSITAKILNAFGGRLVRQKIFELKKRVLASMLIYTAICAALALIASLVPSVPVTVCAILLILIVNVSIYLIFLKSFTSFNEIRKLVSHIQQGDLDYTIDDSLITSSISGFSDEMVGISNGFRLAVDRATRDEKTKTELITNVSHDLKTPLTAIVNYVELIKREETSSEEKQRYLEIIDEKAKQLKSLIDDLTEVSKLSGGNVEFRPANMDLYEFAVQVVGESSDELEAAKIDVRIAEPDCRPIVFADGQKTWRIMENLISNVIKYAMPETRAYVDVSADDEFGYVTVKNISSTPLEMSGDDFCARFTRGDASRSSEGFGLGLSIAKSLCELQNGNFNISVDGDLFKATVALPLAREE